MEWVIYDKSGTTERCRVKDVEYNGSFMGDRTVSCTVESPVMIDFAVGDYLTYRGETFFLDYAPSQTKNSKANSVRNAFEYELIFHTFDVYLQNCLLLDYVPYGNDYHFNPLPSYSFVGTAQTFAERIQANMDREYPGEWTISVHGSVQTDDTEIEIDNTSCWNALVMFNKKWGLNFSVSGKHVYIGYPEDSINHTFYYGKNNGLYRIEREVDSDEAVITRLYAYGSDRNIPADYNKRPSDFSGKKYLMLPGYLTTGKSYIESDNVSVYGIREYVVSFEDIYPSITGTDIPGVGRIDELLSAEQITSETEANGTFKVMLRNIGFDINDHLTQDTATISMKSGSLVGYDFEITEVTQLENGDYELTLNKSTRDNFTVPNAGQNLSAGDQFVLLGISMPDEYVENAEQKLLATAQAYLAAHDHAIYSYSIGMDELYMARNSELHDEIKEGLKLNLYDADLGLDHSIIIQSLRIKEGGDVPEYEVTLCEKPLASTIDKLWDAIDNIRDTGSAFGGSISGSGGSITLEDLNRRYLRKDVDDTAKGNILFERNIGSSIFLDGLQGKGWRIENDGNAIVENLTARTNIFVGRSIGSPVFISGFPNGTGWDISSYQRTNSAGTTETKYRLEIDDINVRGKLRAYEFVISQLRGENDNVIFAGMMKVDHYDATERRLYLDTEEGVLYNPFRSGDILMVQRFGGMPTAENDYNVIKQYELRVDEAGIGNLSDGEDRLDWITFTNFVGDISDIAGGDVLTRVDSVADSTRKGIVKVTTIDEIGAPYIDVVYGMKTDPENATRARMGNLTGIRTKHGIDLTGVWGIYGSGAYFENSTYILDNGNTIEQQFTIINGTLESTIGELRNDMSLEPGNILRNSSFSRDTNYWETGGTVNLWAFNGQFIYANDTFISEKDDFAGIYQDGSRNVLRIRNSYVLQRNDVMDIPVHEEGDEDWTYSFSFFYKVLQAGTLTAGFSGSTLYLSQQLQPTDEYQKLSKVADWNEQGDFRISFTGEILIYGVSLFNDALADAEIRLQTQITQNAELIALKAEKTYVDSETGKIYEKYDGEIKVMADDIALRVTYEDFNTESQALEKRLETKIELTEENINLSVSEQVNTINAAIEAAQTAIGEAEEATKDVADSVISLNDYVDGAFKDGVIEDAEAKAIEKYINTVNSIKKDVDSTYATLYDNLYLDGDPKTNLYNAKKTFDSAISSLIDIINSVISDQKVTETEKNSVDSKFDAFNNAYAGLATSIESANKSIQDKLKGYSDSALAAANAANTAASNAQDSADAAGQSVTDLSDEIKTTFKDGILTDAEKISIGKYLNTVDSTMSDVEATYTKLYANTYLEGTPKSNLKTAYDNLNSAYDSLVAAIEDATADSTASETEFAAVNTKFTTFNSRLSTFKTSIESANKSIQDKLKELADDGISKVQSELNVEKAKISANVTAIDNINGTIRDSGWITEDEGNSWWARKNNVISTINQSPEEVTINASKINLNGKVTFSMFDSSLKDTITGKQDSDKLKDLAFKDEVDFSDLGPTIISGNKILTSLIDADKVIANVANIGGFRIEPGYIGSDEMTLYPSAGLYFTDNSRGVISRIGNQTIPSSSGLTCNLYLKNTDNSNLGMSNGSCIKLEVGGSISSNAPQTWISCTQHESTESYGWGAQFVVEARKLGDTTTMNRTCIQALRFMPKNHLEGWKGASTLKLHTVYWDETSGYFCWQ